MYNGFRGSQSGRRAVVAMSSASEFSRGMAQEIERGQPSVVVIGVNYGTDAMVLRFVRSLVRVSQNFRVTFVLVDNTERADSSELFSNTWAEDPSALCIKSPRNLGYFGGAHFGYGKYLETRQPPDWVIVSNVDIEFKDDALFARLRDVGKIRDVGVVAPSIWSSRSRRDLNPRMVVRPSKGKMRSYKLIFRNYYLLNLHQMLAAVKHRVKYVVKYKLMRPARRCLALFRSNSALAGNSASNSRVKFIYAPQGSCVIFSKLFFSRGGSLDYPLLLFGEEIYVAETARSLGLRVVYDPRLKVWHDDHSATGLVRSRKIASRLLESAIFMADRYFKGLMWWRR